MLCQGHNIKNSLTLHHLAVDPLQVLTREGQGVLQSKKISCGAASPIVQRSALVDLYDTTVGFALPQSIPCS